MMEKRNKYFKLSETEMVLKDTSTWLIRLVASPLAEI